MALPKIFDSLRVWEEEEESLPLFESLDDYLDYLLPKVRAWGEDLSEEAYYVGKGWMEMRDDDHFHQSILHYFQEGGAYMSVVDGDIGGGSWELMEDGSNKMIWDGELYELAFLSPPFFIIKKHGDQQRLGNKKYFVMGLEGSVKNLSWREYAEAIHNSYQEESESVMGVAIAFLVIVAIIIIFSLF